MVDTWRLTFPDDYEVRGEYEAEQREAVDGVVVTTSKGSFELNFMTPARAALELRLTIEAGEPCTADPDLVLIPSVTRATIREAVSFLVQKDHFQPH